MFLLRIGVLILLIYAHYEYNVRCDELNLARHVCEVTERIVAENSDTNDVVIGKFNTRMSNGFFDEISKCISRLSMVITTDFSRKIDDRNLRKAQVVIIVSDETNQVRFYIINILCK